MKLSPKYDFVAVEVHEHEPDTIRGLHVPEQARRNRQAEAGRVIAVGPGRLSEYGPFIAVDVAVGDIVLYPKGAGLAMDPEGRVRLVRCVELVGTLEEQHIVVP